MYINDDVSCNRFEIGHESKFLELFVKENINSRIIKISSIIIINLRVIIILG